MGKPGRHRRRKHTTPRRRQEPEGNWQLWTVFGGVALVLLTVGFLALRGGGVDLEEYEGTVAFRETSARPGSLDRFALRVLGLQQSDGSVLEVEVEKSLYDAVDEGFFVQRTGGGPIDVRDPQGREVDWSAPADSARDP